jgi:hypothetical protein
VTEQLKKLQKNANLWVITKMKLLDSGLVCGKSEEKRPEAVGCVVEGFRRCFPQAIAK